VEKVCELKDRLQCEHWNRGTLRSARMRWKDRCAENNQKEEAGLLMEPGLLRFSDKSG
jgi:hypothetical protein